MKQIGILYKPEMALAIVQRRKTLTSRLRGLDKVNERPDDYYFTRMQDGYKDGTRAIFGFDDEPNGFSIRCPFGTTGDVLIGRETWLRTSKGTLYKAGLDSVEAAGLVGMYGGWKSGMIMPWDRARIRTPIVKVWPSRLQDMTEEMAIQEGVAAGEWITIKGAMGPFECEMSKSADTALEAYAALWDSINGKKHPWDSNPWVWRIQFEPYKASV